MRTLLIAATAAVAAVLALSPAANAQTVQSQQYPFMLGLERAVIIEGTPCLMTTPFDFHARCDATRVNLRCRNPAFEGNKFVCNSGADGVSGELKKPTPAPLPSSPGERP